MAANQPAKNPVNGKTCLYFIAGGIPTAPELVAVGRLSKIYGQVLVQRGDVAADTQYGSALIAADAIAGTTIPSAYSTAIANYPDGDKTSYADAKPSDAEAFIIVTGTRSSSFSHTGTLQLILLAAFLDDTSDAVTIADETTAATWASGTTGNMTIGASTGLVTGVLAGTSLITATYTAASGDTQTKTITLTAT